MGTQCGSYPPSDPNTTNHCNDYNNKYYMRDFCSLAGVGGKSYRQKWCGKLGSENEWGVEDTNGTHTCTYNSCKEYQYMGSGCCKGCCGIVGKSVDCIRRQFNGDPITCCLQDKVCNDYGSGDAPPACFSDSAKKDTCAPCHRDITSAPDTKADGSSRSCKDAKVPSCRELLLDYCSGQDLQNLYDTSWMERWYNPATGEETPMSCPYALKRNLYAGLGCNAADIPFTSEGGCVPYQSSGDLSASGVEWGQQLMALVFEKYRENGFTIGATPGTVGYNPFQEYLYQMCCTTPVICQSGLKESCSVYSTQRLSYYPQVANWCGCYLPDHEYDEYVNRYQINQECTPTCNRPGSIPLVAGDGDPYLCTQTVCLIDDIAINLVSSDISGQISINQVCGNCGNGDGGSCSCIIQDNTITGVEASIGNISINESCGSTQCIITNPDPNGSPPTLTVPCEVATDSNSAFVQEQEKAAEAQAQLTRRENVTRLIIIGVALLLIALLYFLLWGTDKISKKRAKKKGVPIPSYPRSSGVGIGDLSLRGAASGSERDTSIGGFTLTSGVPSESLTSSRIGSMSYGGR